MANKSQKKLQKRKKREKEVKLKLQRRRESAKIEQRKQKAWEKEMEAEEKALKTKPLIAPKKKSPEEVKKCLEHNMQILKALEEEYEKEQAAREDLHSRLEEEGHCTMEEKLNAIQQMYPNAVEETQLSDGEYNEENE